MKGPAQRHSLPKRRRRSLRGGAPYEYSRSDGIDLFAAWFLRAHSRQPRFSTSTACHIDYSHSGWPRSTVNDPAQMSPAHVPDSWADCLVTAPKWVNAWPRAVHRPDVVRSKQRIGATTLQNPAIHGPRPFCGGRLLPCNTPSPRG